MVRMDAHGRVRPLPGRQVDVRFKPLAIDLERMREGVGLACRLFFAAGATEVFPGMASRPDTLTDVSQVRAIEEGPVDPRDFHMLASHLFGTTCAGSDPSRSVVGPDLACHRVSNLFVMDASVFPTNIGVNPQHSIMAIVWRAAQRLAQ
jgi:choline dehydrogenase-like flavoprotein